MRQIIAVCLALIGLVAPSVSAATDTVTTSAGPVRIDAVAGPFEHPWAVAFLTSDNALLVTERGGTVWHIAPGGARQRVRGVPASVQTGQGGLLDVVPARDFAETREVFLSYAAPDGRRTRTTLTAARLSADGARLTDLRVLFAQDPAIRSSRHFGSRIVEAPDGTLYVTVGDRGEPELAQDPRATIGKVMRVTRAGTVPPDNPFVGDPAVDDQIWSLGHRNPQGAGLDETGRLWIVEHGARGGDEINLPQPGRNYGWPRISYGTHYSGLPHPASAAPGLEQPLFYWDPSIAPSGLAVYSGALWSDWAGDLFVGALKSGVLVRLDRQGSEILGEERLLDGAYGRIRDVREGPDGALWFLTDSDRGALYRISPAE
ncbi:MAG: PQQ-dependent sugar dehydrogenase [Pseudomonadota bacterium]